MHFYERMGDTLALQYGGSAAHNKIFSAKRGHLKFAIQSQEFFRTLQRYYSNAYMDAYKQAAINLFLGYFQPQVGKPALWEPESGDEHVLDDETSKLMKRARSDGSILNKSKLSMSSNGPNGVLNSALTGSKNEGQHPNWSSDSVHGMSKSRSKAISTPDVNISTDDGVHDVIYGITDDQAAEIQAQGLSKDFVQWVNQGETFWY
ncbi:Phosphoinositide phosphatase SAC2 [Zea mays]|uniref:Phosphoinositide phosphatase SAC2 n=1 Tax=Zea mays TaxID=4577 RepID=A0A1D6LU17_MAIZE|nr:Phosphoinositide phosphatase SAC2 [Zea mays]